MSYIAWLLFIGSHFAVNASVSFPYSLVSYNNNQMAACASYSPPNRTLTGSKGYCASTCNKLAGCGWFNFVEDDTCNSRRNCDATTGKCQLFAYQPDITAAITGCSVWQRGQLPNPPIFLNQGIGNALWILVQQNYGSPTNPFDVGWNAYKNGFGDVRGDYWIGNERLHALTSSGRYRLRFELQALANSQWYWAEYSTFKVDSEAAIYTLTVSGYTGNAGNSFQHHFGLPFSTLDSDNSGYGCPTGKYGNSGGFWYLNCGVANINGSPTLYLANGPDGFRWDDLPGLYNDKLLISRMWLVLN